MATRRAEVAVYSTFCVYFLDSTQLQLQIYPKKYLLIDFAVCRKFLKEFFYKPSKPAIPTTDSHAHPNVNNARDWLDPRHTAYSTLFTRVRSGTTGQNRAWLRTQYLLPGRWKWTGFKLAGRDRLSLGVKKNEHKVACIFALFQPRKVRELNTQISY